MAVTTTIRVAGPFLGDGATVNFGFTFKVFLPADLLVVQADASGNVSTLNLGTNYSVALNANQDVSAGGSVTLTVAPPRGTVLVLTSDVAELQQVVLSNLGGFYPDVLNSVFDRLTIFVQQLQVTANRSLQFPLTDTTSAVLPSALQRANAILAFDTNGAITLLPSSSLGGGSQASGGSGILLVDPVTAVPFTLEVIGGRLALVPTSPVLVDTVTGAQYRVGVATDGSGISRPTFTATSGAPFAVNSLSFVDQSTNTPRTLVITNGTYIIS